MASHQPREQPERHQKHRRRDEEGRIRAAPGRGARQEIAEDPGEEQRAEQHCEAHQRRDPALQRALRVLGHGARHQCTHHRMHEALGRVQQHQHQHHRKPGREPVAKADDRRDEQAEERHPRLAPARDRGADERRLGQRHHAAKAREADPHGELGPAEFRDPPERPDRRIDRRAEEIEKDHRRHRQDAAVARKDGQHTERVRLAPDEGTALLGGEGLGQRDQAEDEIRERKRRRGPERHPRAERAEHAPEPRPEHEAQPEGRPHQAEDAGTVLGRRHIGKAGIGDHEGRAAAAGDDPPDEQPAKAWRQRMQHIVKPEPAHRQEQQRPAPDPVRKRAEHRCQQELGERIDGKQRPADGGGIAQPDMAHLLDQPRHHRQDQAETDHVDENDEQGEEDGTAGGGRSRRRGGNRGHRRTRSDYQMGAERRKIAVIVEQGLGGKPGDPGPLGPEGDQHAGHPRGARGLAVGRGVADKERARDSAPRAGDRRGIGRGIGLAHRQRVGADQRIEKPGDAQIGNQAAGQPLGLVGADRGGKARAAQRLDRLGGARVKAGALADMRAVMGQKRRIIGLGQGLGLGVADPAIAKPQHRAPAVKGGQRIGARIEQIAQPAGAKAGIRRGDQIGRGIGQRAVEIENHRAHSCLLLVTPRKRA
ncbi:hypothetical protein SDC9_20680 [bioreactor metagenome]|uniref:Uncharacterized protein n=1 Tax=bioreactor metagenome TaxID=1076179 RepID=A0A644U7F4_9ZZZZ